MGVGYSDRDGVRTYFIDGRLGVYASREEAQAALDREEAQRQKQLREALSEGWDRAHPGACYDPVANAHYPWHDEYVGPRRDQQGKCVRCGEHRPT